MANYEYPVEGQGNDNFFHKLIVSISNKLKI